MKQSERSNTIEAALRLRNIAWYLGSIEADKQFTKRMGGTVASPGEVSVPGNIGATPEAFPQNCGCVECEKCKAAGCPDCSETGYTIMCNQCWDDHQQVGGFQGTGLPESFFK